jgi:hypothetical protein
VRWRRVTVVCAVTCTVTGAVGCAGGGRQVLVPGSAYGLATITARGTGSPAGQSSAVPSMSTTPASTTPASTTPASTAPASTAPLRARWPQRVVLPENATELDADQFLSLIFDLAAGVLYTIVAEAPASARYVPEVLDLRTGRVRRGESYPVAGLALAWGYLWVYGSSGGHPLLDQASPGTMATIRSVRVPGISGVQGVAAVAAGPAGSVWVGEGRTLLRLSVRTGAVLARGVLPAGLDLTDLAAGGGNLYASATRLQPGGGVVLEYSEASGRLLAQTGRVPLTWALWGPILTPVPGAVWALFRTGMMGESELLSARSLSVVRGPLTVFSAADSPATGPGTVYSWAMGSISAYGGGALWVATSGGVVACVNPATGTVRAQEVVPSDPAWSVFALAADPRARQLVAVISAPGYAGVVTISPPSACWN